MARERVTSWRPGWRHHRLIEHQFRMHRVDRGNGASDLDLASIKIVQIHRVEMLGACQAIEDDPKPPLAELISDFDVLPTIGQELGVEGLRPKHVTG